MPIPIKIMSHEGEREFNIIKHQYDYYKIHGPLFEFKNRCDEDYRQLELSMGNWLDSDLSAHRIDEDHPENMARFKVLSDVCSSLKYFSNKAA